ncbi:MAG TPA: hypothetical protein VLB29_00325 [Nocardioidaceae bacterium]|nr:hypothetical protein [Nocardioidaceae bacterium]
MGNIGTERKVVEFEPLEDEPQKVADPRETPEPAAPPAPLPAKQ